MKKKRIAAIVCAVLIAGIFLACGLYIGDYYRADDMALDTLHGSADVQVAERDETIAFVPNTYDTGLIFYPGGKVEHTAYAPLMRALSERGILCILVEMPFRLAVLDMNAAEGVAEQYPAVKAWAIGGHSLGGSMAASYAAKHADSLDALVLLAAYSTADLSGSELDVLSVYGSNDGVLNMDKYQQYWKNLPEDTKEIILDGGNHAQFGAYGFQNGDGKATMRAEDQLQATADAIADLLYED